MDAREYFNYVAMPKYNEFVQSPNDFGLLCGAMIIGCQSNPA
jgi:hypothetical protein